MRKLIVFFLLLMAATAHSQDNGLFPVLSKDVWGYMDNRGKMVIKPQFDYVQKFAEGLAPVRIKGKYGYINTSGNVVIPAIYDFAWSFNHGYAMVYESSIPQIIRKDGQLVFKNIHPGLTMANENRFIIKTAGHKQGVVDARGKLVIDTVFAEIKPTINNLYIVRGTIGKVSTYSDDAGLVDGNGNFIVPYGLYRYIWPFSEGLARVQRMIPDDSEEDDYEGFIDTQGKLVIKITDKKVFDLNDFNGEFSKVGLLKKEKDYSNDSYYEGFLDKKGNLAINDHQYRYVFGFASNRAFALTRDSKYYLLDRSGKQVNKDSYREIREEGFMDGKGLVSAQNGWQVIDTNGNVLMKKDIYFDRTIYINNILFYYDQDDKKWRFWDFENDEAPKIAFDDFDPEGFHNGLLLIRNRQRLSYIDKKGKTVWEQSNSKKGREALNIDYMKRGYYYAYSSPADESQSGGWAVSKNVPSSDASHTWIKKGELNFHLSAEDTVLNKTTVAKKLFIVNETSDTVFFPAQDSRLYLTIQALNEKGEWKDIEYLPSSWCGNSYHTIQLAPGEYWKFATPVYKGGFKTKLRASLRYQQAKDRTRDTDYLYIYSNEFEASINPAQFWRKLDYHPGGLMDPYND